MQDKKDLNITLIKNKPTMFTECTTVYLLVDSNNNIKYKYYMIEAAKAALSIYEDSTRIVEATEHKGTILAIYD
jgi:hypothetical protein